ncbi:MAG: tRNA-binding protein [Chitinophagales bacterium]|nr:tRNA-binding protein [Chitinophagaceae bacterium]MBP9883228.1 tRNA-binding protein [Chitinophagales bacterium]
MITWQDFEKLEMHVGTIINVEDFPKAKKPAYQLTIDFGALGLRKSSAQLTALYSKEDLVDKQVIAVLNFPVKKIADFLSECLVLGAIREDGAVILLQPDRNAANGLRIG